jgi:hypothetical protein
MVYGSMILVKANALFSPLEGFDPASLRDMLDGVETIAQAANSLGMEGVVPSEFQQPLMDFLETIPPSIDAAALAAMRSALERGLRVTLTWEPAYYFELKVWDVSKLEGETWVGLVNVNLSARDPEMEMRA